MATTTINGDKPSSESSLTTIETPLLIVGAGPAGGSLACFLSHPPYSMTGILISTAPTTSQTPRAHITNPACFECLRDIDLEQTCLAQATPSEHMQHTRWCHSMTGHEYARIYSWGNDPKRRADYDAASPCHHVDLPQTVFEPILTQRAAADGWSIRFHTSIVSFTREPSGTILSLVIDSLSNHSYQIRSQYLFGCDGGRSQIMRQLDIPLIKKPGQGLALNILVRVDLSDYVEARRGNLHWVFQPDQPYPDFAWSGLIRMVKPWHEWMFIFFPKQGVTYTEPTMEQWVKRCKQVVGRDDLPLEVLDVSKWYINEIVAEHYSYPEKEPNVLCLGDAVHRHPPFNGLGSNTCVQDAYNLAWKVKYVSAGLAGKGLLESFSTERQPVGAGVIARANQGIRDHTPVWEAMGLMEATVEERNRVSEVLKEATREGRERRKRWNEAIEGTSHEFHGIGVEMNHRYASKGVRVDEEEGPPTWPEDKVLYHLRSTYPGHRLPHAWLNKRMPDVEHTSTIDLAGHGVFALLTGIGGDGWKKAAQSIGKELGVELRAYSIGWDQDWEDVYRDWERVRGVQEDGCVLVRPDRFVAWRAMDSQGDQVSLLRVAMKQVLDR